MLTSAQHLCQWRPHVALYEAHDESIHKRDQGASEQLVNNRINDTFVRSDMVTLISSGGDRLSQYDDSLTFAYPLEPFEPDFLTHGKPSAYPPNRSLAVLPSNLYLGWMTKPSADKFMADAIRRSVASFEAGIRGGQELKNAATYVNYALFGTPPLEAKYGEHLERLREIKKMCDHENVMGLAGEWKF
jgi:hypothetical protein